MYGYGYGLGGTLMPSDGLSPVFFIMAGQSNMRGKGTPFPADLQGDIANVNIWNGSSFETLNGSVDNNNQLGQAQGTFGPEMSFLKAVAQTRQVYCVKYAVGATSLSTLAQGGTTTNWNINSISGTPLYDNLVAYVNDAIALLPTGTAIGGFFWYQGEGDSTSTTIADLYLTNLSDFISNFRTDTSQPSLKFYITRILNITDAGIATISPVVRLSQTKYAYDNYGDAYLISVDDLGIEGDYTHLTAQGYVDCGERYANSITTPPSNVSLLLSDSFSGVTISNKDWIVTGTGISQNNKLIITNNHAGTVAFESARKLTNRYVMPASTGTIYGRVKMSWTDPTQTNESTGGFLIHTDSNNYVGVITDVTVVGGNALKIRKRVAGVNTDTAIAAVNGDEFKIKYDNTTGNYEIWYWTAGAWSSLGTGTAFTSRVKFVFTTNDSATYTGGDEYYFEDFDVTLEDFTTRRP